MKIINDDTETFEFRIDTIAFLNEVIDYALRDNQGVLKIPFNIFRILLLKVAERSIELNDPIMNLHMVNLGLYEMPKPNTKEHRERLKLIQKLAREQHDKEMLNKIVEKKLKK